MIYKFRAWHKKRKKFYEVSDLHIATLMNGGIWATVNGRDCIEYKDIKIQIQPEDIEIVMFTGLHDKNGKELYYKDRVKELEYGQIGTIEFNDGCFGLVIDGEIKYTPLFRFYRAGIELEIIEATMTFKIKK